MIAASKLILLEMNIFIIRIWRANAARLYTMRVITDLQMTTYNILYVIGRHLQVSNNLHSI